MLRTDSENIVEKYIKSIILFYPEEIMTENINI